MEAVYSFKILNKCFFDKKQQKKLDKKLFLNILFINIILDFILIIVFNWFSFFKNPNQIKWLIYAQVYQSFSVG